MKLDYDSLPTLMLVAAGLFVMFASPEVESAGKRLGDEDNELYGNAYVLGSDSSVDVVMGAIDAYNEGNAEKEATFYTKEMNERGAEFSRQWHESTKSLNQQPWAVIPVRLIGDDKDLVLVWSVEDRVWENGSTQTLDLMEVFPVDDNGKISGFSQWRSERPDNEFSYSSGGKFFGRNPDNEFSGRPLVFSNRGEVETLENLFSDYNKMDGEAVSSYFADEWTFRAAKGGTSERTREGVKSIFDNLESVEWTPFSMTPLKIYDTNPESGVTVYSKEKRVSKDGSVWEKELVELFYFDLDGKISGVEQFQRDLDGQTTTIESAGIFEPGEENQLNGKPFVLADDKYMEIVQKSTDAYNARDWEAMSALYTDEFNEGMGNNLKDYFENFVEKLNMDIYSMLPVKIEGSDWTRVLTWATEDRLDQDGSKERVNLFEIYYVSPEGKLGGWNQWYNPNSDPEFTSFGLPQGGKIYTNNEYDGRPLVFSNRGEVEIMEEIVEAYNNKDVDGFLKHFADEWTATDYEGNTETRTKANARESMQQYFDQSETIDWKPWSIYALKIKDTDPGSGITVRSTEKRVGKDGSVWNKRLVEWFYFDPNGKITRFSQFAQDIQSEE